MEPITLIAGGLLLARILSKKNESANLNDLGTITLTPEQIAQANKDAHDKGIVPPWIIDGSAAPVNQPVTSIGGNSDIYVPTENILDYSPGANRPTYDAAGNSGPTFTGANAGNFGADDLQAIIKKDVNYNPATIDGPDNAILEQLFTDLHGVNPAQGYAEGYFNQVPTALQWQQDTTWINVQKLANFLTRLKEFNRDPNNQNKAYGADNIPGDIDFPVGGELTYDKIKSYTTAPSMAARAMQHLDTLLSGYGWEVTATDIRGNFKDIY